jgi:hypothetical protein
MPKAIKRLRPDAHHFFDTNFFVLNATDLPRLVNVPTARKWVTETVEAEVEQKLEKSVATKVLESHRVLRFSDLYSEDPNVCPTFYAYVQAMYNPAIVGSPDFSTELLLSRRINGVATDEDNRAYERIRRTSEVGHAMLPDGTPKPQELVKLERHDAATRKKIVATIRDGHPAVVNDIKNLALVLYFCLSTRQNVVFYTADVDPVSLFLRWLESMSMEWTLRHEVLARLGTDSRGRVRCDQPRVVIPVDEFVQRRHRLFKDMVRDSYKASGCRFTIKRWNQNAHAFDEDIYITFEEKIAEALAHTHGNLQCHFTQNNEFGNWLHLLYRWPPVDPASGQLSVVLRLKGINVRSTKVSAHEHDAECLYRREDAGGHLHEWSQFT